MFIVDFFKMESDKPFTAFIFKASFILSILFLISSIFVLVKHGTFIPLIIGVVCVILFCILLPLYCVNNS